MAWGTFDVRDFAEGLWWCPGLQCCQEPQGSQTEVVSFSKRSKIAGELLSRSLKIIWWRVSQGGAQGIHYVVQQVWHECIKEMLALVHFKIQITLLWNSRRLNELNAQFNSISALYPSRSPALSLSICFFADTHHSSHVELIISKAMIYSLLLLIRTE